MKISFGTSKDYLKAFLYSIAGLLIGTIAPVGIVAFGMMGRFGGMNKYLAYIAVGALVGIASSLITSVASIATGFLPGILGTVAGWLISGFVITFLVGIILKAFGARK